MEKGGKWALIVIVVVALLSCITTVGGIAGYYYLVDKPKRDFGNAYSNYQKATGKAWQQEDEKSTEVSMKYEKATKNIQSSFMDDNKAEMLKQANDGLAAGNGWEKLINDAEASFPALEKTLKALDEKASRLSSDTEPAGKVLIAKSRSVISARKDYYQEARHLIDNKKTEYEQAIKYAEGKIDIMSYLTERNNLIDEWNTTLIPARERTNKKLATVEKEEAEAYSDILSKLR